MTDVLAGAILGLLIAHLWGQPKWDSTDDRANKVHSGLTVYTDHATGVQYLSNTWGITLTPRLDKDGKTYKGK